MRKRSIEWLNIFLVLLNFYFKGFFIEYYFLNFGVAFKKTAANSLALSFLKIIF